MKPVIIFFFSLCFILAGGSKYSHAEVQQIRKAEHVKSGISNHDFSLLKKHNVSEKKEDFLGDEDDDEDITFTRKHLSPVKYFVTLAYASILICFYHYFKNRLPFCKHFSYTASYIYLLQRVLRI